MKFKKTPGYVVSYVLIVILAVVALFTWCDALSGGEELLPDHYRVVNQHGDGEYLIVKRGKEETRLHCRMRNNCYPFEKGTLVKLEKWLDDHGTEVYVYRQYSADGEFEYREVFMR